MQKYLIVLFSLVFLGCSTIPHRKEYVSNHPELSDDVKNNILKGSVSIGMSKEQVIASWGNTYTKGKSVSENLNIEQWVYQNRYVVYFENDKVVAIDELATFL